MAGVTFKLARAVFTPSLVARDLVGAVHFHPSVIAFDDINGSLAGGRIASAMAFSRNPDGLAAHGKIELADAAAATILGPSLNATDGQADVDVCRATASARVRSASSAPCTAAARWRSKTFRLAGSIRRRSTPPWQAAGQSGPIDVAKVQAAVNAALAKGHLTVPQGSAPIDISRARSI